MRPIDADAVCSICLCEYTECPCKELGGCTIKNVPTLTLDDLRPKGRWVDHCVRDWRCSECGEKINKVRSVDGYCYDDKPNYCPNCGADMRGGGEDG